MQGINAQIRAQYSQGSAFLPRDMRFFFPDHIPYPPSCGSSHTQCVAKTRLCGARTLDTTQKMEGINKNFKQLLLGFKINDNLRITSPKSQKAESGMVRVDHLLPALALSRQLYIFHATCWLPAGCSASESTTPLFCSGSENSATADELKAFQALV